MKFRPSKPMAHIIRLSLLTGLVSCLGGCVFPVHLSDKEPFREETIGFIEIGVTPKDQIRQALGASRKSFLGGQVWVYREHQKMTEWLWFMCGAYGQCGGDTVGGDIREYSLVIFFDAEEIVEDLQVTTAGSRCFSERRACYEDGFLYFERKEDLFGASNLENCHVQVFVSRMGNPYLPVWIEVDDYEPATALIALNEKSLIYKLPVGPHKFDLYVDYPLEEFSESVSIDCKAGADYVLELYWGRSSDAWAKVTDRADARLEAAERKLYLAPDLDIR